MAKKGYDGIVKIGASGVVAQVRNWSIEEQAKTQDSSCMGGDGWETHEQTLKNWGGSIDCFWDESDADGQGALDIGGSVTLKVYPEGDATGDTYYHGTATVTQITKNAAHSGLVEAAFQFQGNGALTEATAA